ncbi:hypothetical protein ELQ92_09230 [Labedella populi]|uniref:Uncharacterized protein n=1 Tax=Labedella populi TaxID=2498850 RepID=A0A3S4E1I5_9MICO|nr:hypothetical protein [Labedella populi]RWZ61198.1 hypothetical protein ELQ92_09230 [Labedella populi]
MAGGPVPPAILSPDTATAASGALRDPSASGARAGLTRPAPGVPRRSSAQVLLLSAGVVLVSVFAIFFAVLAYVVASIETRSILTAGASLVVLGIAWLLRRRGLDGTAEGIAVIGVVLLLLDVWIVRTNGILSADTVDVSLYTGLAFLVVSAVLVGVSRLTGLRAASVSAAVIAPSGLFAFVLGVTVSSMAEWTSVLLAAVALLTVVLVERVPGVPRVEAVVLRIMSIGGGVLAVLAAVSAFPSLDGGAVLGFGLAGVGWLIHLLTVHGRDGSLRVPRGRAWAVIAAAGFAVAAVGLTSRAIVATAETTEQASGLHAAGMTVTAGAILWGARAVRAPLSRSFRVSGTVVAAAAALSLVPVLAAILPPLVGALVSRPFRASLLEPVGDTEPGALWFVVGVALASAATIGALAALGSRRLVTALSWVPVCLATFALLGAGMLAPSLLASVAITIIGAALFLLVSGWRRPEPPARVTAFIGALVSACSAAALASASTGSWLLGALVVLALLGAARLVARRAPHAFAYAGAVVTSTLGAGLVLWVGSLLPMWAAIVTRRPDATPLGFGTATAAVVILGALAFVARRTPAPEVAILGGLAVFVLLPAAVSVWATGDLVADVGWRLVLATLAVAAAAAWLVLGRTTAIRSVGIGVGITLLTLLTAEVSVLVSAGSSELPGSLVGAALLSVLSAVRLVTGRIVRVAPPPTALFRAATSSIAATAAVTLVLAVLDEAPLTRLTLLVLALVPTFLAFAAPEHGAPRRHLAWVGAALAVAALWWFLADERVTAIEYYSLPVAGLLLAVAGVAGVAGRGSRQDHPFRGRPSSPGGLDVLLGAGLAVAILPSACVAAQGAPARAITTAVIGAVLIGLALVALRDDGTIRFRSIVWIAGVIAVALPVVVRLANGETSSVSGSPDGAADLTLWVGPVVLVLIAAALGVSRIRRAPVLSDIAATAALVAVGVAVPTALTSGRTDGAEASPWLLITCAVTVVAFSLDRTVRAPDGLDGAHGGTPAPTQRQRPSARTTAVLGAAASTAIAVTSLPSAESVEWVSVPLGVAAVVAGVISLHRDLTIGSWPTLAPGILILLLPSLAYDLGDADLWRVIALGTTGVVVTIAGARWRLQSPLVIGAVVTILHGLAQLWPWISGLYDAGYWWVWAGVGGVLLITFAARYEQRMQSLRAVGRALQALR